MLAADDFTFTTGLVGGETVQFADGRWPGEVGAGIAITEEGFELVVPHLRAAAPEWAADHRYGVFELSANARRDLAKRLRNEAAMIPRAKAQSAMFTALAAWLEERFDEGKPVGVFGI